MAGAGRHSVIGSASQLRSIELLLRRGVRTAGADPAAAQRYCRDKAFEPDGKRLRVQSQRYGYREGLLRDATTSNRETMATCSWLRMRIVTPDLTRCG